MRQQIVFLYFVCIVFFVQQEAPTEAVTHAYGKTIIYEESSGLITIIDDARLIQDKNSFSGKRIEYDTLKKVVSAKGGGEEKNQRVTIEYFPKPKAVSDSSSKESPQQ